MGEEGEEQQSEEVTVTVTSLFTSEQCPLYEQVYASTVSHPDPAVLNLFSATF